MCFSVNVNIIKEELEKRYGATFLDPEKYSPSYYYHAFSLPELPAICAGSGGKIRILKWGLIPPWVKSMSDANVIRYKTFNARSETINSKPSFSGSFRSKRCIIPVQGFFEWQHTNDGKIPWYIYNSDNQIISLAGLWNEWVENNTGDVIATFSIITTEANNMMAGIHNSGKRMPAILHKEDEDKWLSLPAEPTEVLSLLKPSPEDFLKAHTISKLINQKKAEKNTPALITPFLYGQGRQLF